MCTYDALSHSYRFVLRVFFSCDFRLVSFLVNSLLNLLLLRSLLERAGLLSRRGLGYVSAWGLSDRRLNTLYFISISLWFWLADSHSL
jgi:hypothetical protein